VKIRAKLVRLAEHYGFVIFADNFYRELKYAMAHETIQRSTSQRTSCESTPSRRRSVPVCPTGADASPWGAGVCGVWRLGGRAGEVQPGKMTTIAP